MSITVDDVVNAFAVKNENDEIVSFDFEAFDKFVFALHQKRREILAAKKEEENKKKLEEKEMKNEIGKEYYYSLDEGDEFSYKNFKGNTVRARKISIGNAAVCEVISGIDCDKTKKRAVPFHQIIIPAEKEKEILEEKEKEKERLLLEEKEESETMKELLLLEEKWKLKKKYCLLDIYTEEKPERNKL